MERVEVGRIYQSNSFGQFEVIMIEEEIIIRFLETGFETKVNPQSVYRRSVKDRLLPSMRGIGYLGNGDKHKVSVNNKVIRKYHAWSGMFGRCYDEAFLKKNPNYLGCSVCEEWHDYQNFGDWYDKNYIEGYSLDKDHKVEGNKVYSPSTCSFIPQGLNAAIANQKSFRFLSPEGIVVHVNNLRNFCRQNNLHPGQMSRVHQGLSKTCKQWRKAPED